MPLVAPKKSRRFLDQMLKKHDRLMNKAVGAYTRKVEKKQPIHPEYAASLLDQMAAEDAVFTADTGMCNVWTARYINPLGTRRLIGSFLHGSMANALAARDRRAGGLSRAPGHFRLGRRRTVHAAGRAHHGGRAPAARQRGGLQQLHLGMVKLEMLVDGLPDFGVDVPDANYAAVANPWASMRCASRIRRTSRQPTGRPSHIRSVAGGTHHGSQCPVHSAENHRLAGPRIRYRHVQGGPEPGRRRSCQHGAQQPAEHSPAVVTAGRGRRQDRVLCGSPGNARRRLAGRRS
jgi:hypothetical protein